MIIRIRLIDLINTSDIGALTRPELNMTLVRSLCKKYAVDEGLFMQKLHGLPGVDYRIV